LCWKDPFYPNTLNENSIGEPIVSTKISYHELHHARDSYITFTELFIGVKGYRYERRKKYRLTSQDTKYLYCMSDKIRKSDLDNVEYTIEPKKTIAKRK